MSAPVARAVARAAAVIAALTILSRLTGFGRILVFGRTVGTTCLGDTYQAINTVPNIVFEVVAGGALASLVVPLLAAAATTGDRARMRDGASALVTWTLLVLIPLAVLIALFAEPISRFLLGDKVGCGDDAVRVGAAMMRVFAPQIPLYGVGIVLTGVLQAARRFGGPALAPLLSSLVVIAAYVGYAVQAPEGTDVATVSAAEQLTLSVGTTLGVVVLTVSLLVPLTRAGLRLRPRLHFPAGMAGRARALASAGVLGLGAQQAAVAVTLVLGNGAGVPSGRMTVYTFAQTLFLLPWAVLAVPIATAVFPQLAARWDSGDRGGYARAVAGSLRALVFAGTLSAAVLIAAAGPLARVLVQGVPGAASVTPLAAGIAALAPGLIGYGLYALLSRALYAQGSAWQAALATVAGWVTVVVADLALAQAFRPADRVLALGLGNTVGMTVLGALLVIVIGRRCGRPVFAGVPLAVLAGTAGAALAGGAGLLVSRLPIGAGLFVAFAQSVLVAAVVVAIFIVVVWRFGGADAGRLLLRARAGDA